MYDTTFDENTSPFCTNSLLHSRDISEFPVNPFVIHVLLYVPQNIKEYIITLMFAGKTSLTSENFTFFCILVLFVMNDVEDIWENEEWTPAFQM